MSFWGLGYPGIGNIAAKGVSLIAWAWHRFSNSFPGSPNDIEYARWIVEVLNHNTHALGYKFRLPRPGSRIPRSDMLPLLSLFSLGMSGIDAPFGPPEQNDGIVDTVSMR
jgi:hypothetical protein